MDYLASPALLGGIMIGIALSAWMLGRWQRSVPLAGEALAVPRPALGSTVTAGGAATPCQSEARSERQQALGQTLSLSDLHDEISAYRQQERIFASLADDAFRVAPWHTAARPDCRYMGLTGQPTCAVPPAAIAACGCGQEPVCLWQPAPLVEAARQPSLDCSPFTRV